VFPEPLGPSTTTITAGCYAADLSGWPVPPRRPPAPKAGALLTAPHPATTSILACATFRLYACSSTAIRGREGPLVHGLGSLRLSLPLAGAPCFHRSAARIGRDRVARREARERRLHRDRGIGSRIEAHRARAPARRRFHLHAHLLVADARVEQRRVQRRGHRRAE